MVVEHLVTLLDIDSCRTDKMQQIICSQQMAHSPNFTVAFLEIEQPPSSFFLGHRWRRRRPHERLGAYLERLSRFDCRHHHPWEWDDPVLQVHHTSKCTFSRAQLMLLVANKTKVDRPIYMYRMIVEEVWIIFGSPIMLTRVIDTGSTGIGVPIDR